MKANELGYIEYGNLCLKCMHMKNDPSVVCSHCGFNINKYIPESNALPLASVLNNRYLIGVPLGIGGFGITYIAYDMKVGGICAIKEYMPDAVSYRKENQTEVSVGNTKTDVFEYGLNRFTEEAKMLRQFSKSRNIINVFDNFCENSTAYYAMEYLDGHDLRHEMNKFSEITDFNYILSCLMQVMDGLEELHKKGVLHRDISPDNIYITKKGVIKILDFGSARYSLSQKDRHLSVIVKAGYAPCEQYSTKSEQGPWTDIYALCATFYHLITGTAPPESTERMMHDTLKPVYQINKKIPKFLSDVISKGMELEKSNRYQSIAEMRNAILLNIKSNYPINKNHIKNSEVINKKPKNNPKIKSRTNINIKISKPEPANNSQNKHQIYLKRRIAATAIDYLIIGLIVIFLWCVLKYIFYRLDILDEYMKPIKIVSLFLIPIFTVLINTSFEISHMQGTIGKILTGIKVVDLYGNRVANLNGLKRNIIKLLGIFLLLTETNGKYLHETKTNTKVVLK